jgi:5-oxoprolinase (ATP-hydrolysing)
MSEALIQLGDGSYSAEQSLDDGTRLAVRITLAEGKATIDFNGSADVHPGNLNATPAIVHSVVVYVLRLLIQEDIPLNEGLLAPVRIIIPPGILAPPFGTTAADFGTAPSIVGGNVETSQRLVDLLLLALQTCAASQGTMNNLLFGNNEFSYYETVGGGSGGGPGWDGTSGVHCHMTNTRITDPELLELRYPVRLDRFALRKNSGGRGRHPGGDGLIREFTFLAPLELSLLSQRRQSGPYGLLGGHPGKPGSQQLVKNNGQVVALDGISACTVTPGERLILQTPGGGGYGRPGSAEPGTDEGPGSPGTTRDAEGKA